MNEIDFMQVWKNIKTSGENKNLDEFLKWIDYLDSHYEMDDIVKNVTLLTYCVYAFNSYEQTKLRLIALKQALVNHYDEESDNFDVAGKLNGTIKTEIIKLGCKQELDQVLECLKKD